MNRNGRSRQIAHNICCLILSQVELGIEPVFADVPASVAKPMPEPVAVAADFDPRNFRFSD